MVQCSAAPFKKQSLHWKDLCICIEPFDYLKILVLSVLYELKYLSLFLTFFWSVTLQILVNSVSPNRPAMLYEKVTVSEGGSPLLRDMLFSQDQQNIYTLTERQVSSVIEMYSI